MQDERDAYPSTAKIDGLLVFALSWGFLAIMPDCFDVFDEGLLANTAERIHRGEILYRDVFSYWNPGSFWLLDALFSVAGVSVQTLRVSLTLLGAGAAVGVWRLARDHAGRPASVLAALAVPAVCYPIWWVASPHWYATFISIAATLALCRSLGSHGNSLAIFVTGMLCGLTFVFLQPAGAFLCVAVGGVVAWDTAWFESKASAVKRVGVLALGALVPIVPMYLYFAANGAFSAMVMDTILWNLNHYSPNLEAAYGAGNSFQEVALPLDMLRRAILMALPPLTIATGLALTLSKYFGGTAQKSDRRLFALAVASGGFLSGNYYYPDAIHLAFAAPPAFALFAALGSRFYRATRIRLLGGAVAISCLLIVAFVGVSSLQQSRLRCAGSVSTPRGTIAMNRDLLDHRPILSFLAERLSPEEQFYVYPYAPGYHFLSAHGNAAPLDGVNPYLPTFNTVEQLEKVVSSLEKKQVRYVLVIPFGLNVLEVRNSVLERYIRAEYHVASRDPYILERDGPGRRGDRVPFTGEP